MRIIGGHYRGKKLTSPLDHQTRPTSDRVRENLFNILTHRLSFEGIRVLDLFSGTGALGIEALSRGAAHATFVEHHPPALQILRKNTADFKERLSILAQDSIKLIESSNNNYDLIFLDPPYNFQNLEDLMDKILKNQLLKKGGLLIIETDKKTILSKPQEKRTYGNTTLWILEN